MIPKQMPNEELKEIRARYLAHPNRELLHELLQHIAWQKGELERISYQYNTLQQNYLDEALKVSRLTSTNALLREVVEAAEALISGMRLQDKWNQAEIVDPLVAALSRVKAEKERENETENQINQ
jgi:hypothetical protein